MDLIEEVDLDDNLNRRHTVCNIAGRLYAIPAKSLAFELDSKSLETLDVHRHTFMTLLDELCSFARRDYKLQRFPVGRASHLLLGTARRYV